jgi:ectoine hydroxylase-related dioxygenase (phytanoyl-CoA dioxygenase family)
MAELAIWPEILTAVEKVLLGPAEAPSADCIQLHLTQAIGIEPGEPAQALHRDDAMFPFRIGRELMINVMWTLDEFTPLNGATKVIPGSHLWSADRRGEDREACSAMASPGSAIIWLGSTWHGGGANRSNACRRGVVISYSLGWLAQAEKLLLSLPPATVRRLPARLQTLIGYQVHRPNLGWIEGRDPLEWLHGSTAGLQSPADHMTPEMQKRIEARLAQRNLQAV